MLSSLDALASKISPGTGNKTPSQQKQQQQQHPLEETPLHQRQLESDRYGTALQSTDRDPTTIDIDFFSTIQATSHLLSETGPLPAATARLNGSHCNGLDGNGNKLGHSGLHSTVHPYHKQTNSPLSSLSNNNSNSSNNCQQQNAKLAAANVFAATLLAHESALQQQQQKLQHQKQQEQQQKQFEQFQNECATQLLFRTQQLVTGTPTISPSPNTCSPPIHIYEDNDSPLNEYANSCLKDT